jgi:hypothetical protein
MGPVGIIQRKIPMFWQFLVPETGCPNKKRLCLKAPNPVVSKIISCYLMHICWGYINKKNILRIYSTQIFQIDISSHQPGIGVFYPLPSGKRLHNYGKSPFFDG